MGNKVFEDYCDKELGAVGVLSSVGHRQPASAIVLQLEVLIGKPGKEEGVKKVSTTDQKLTSLRKLNDPQCHHHV